MRRRRRRRKSKRRREQQGRIWKGNLKSCDVKKRKMNRTIILCQFYGVFLSFL